MSRAKEAALKEYPISTPPSYIDGHDLLRQEAFIKGYEQAEKDLALTTDDVWRIFNLVRELQTKYSATDGCLQEVADIFNEQRQK